jgi:hypothetical protein
MKTGNSQAVSAIKGGMRDGSPQPMVMKEEEEGERSVESERT